MFDIQVLTGLSGGLSAAENAWFVVVFVCV